MPDSAVQRFTDPYEYQAAVRASDINVFVTEPGEFRAQLTRIDLHQLWMQRGQTSLLLVEKAAVNKHRSIIFFVADPQQTPMYHSGLELLPTDVVFITPGSEHHIRASPESRWGSMSLAPEHLAAAGRDLAGFDLVAPLQRVWSGRHRI